MSKRIFKRIAALLLTAVMVCSICLPVSAAGYGTVNSKASSVKIAATGGGDFILKKNTATISFKMKNNCQVRVYVQDSEGNTAWYTDVANVKANKTYTVTWNGKKTNGKYVSISGTYKRYRVCVRAGSTKSYSSYIKLYKTSPFGEGVGSKKDPYKVKNAAQLAKVNSFPSRYFIQVGEIDFDYEEAPMITAEFNGNYDGDGYAIKNAVFRSTESGVSMALFNKIGEKGVVQNVVMDGCMTMCNSSGALLAVENAGNIQGCTIMNGEIDANANEGTVCVTNSGTIQDCLIQNVKTDGAGICRYNNGTIQKSAVSDIKGQSDYRCSDGFVYENTGKISSVTGTEIKASWGIAHYNRQSGTIKNSKVIGDISGNDMLRDNYGLIQGSSCNGEQKIYSGNYGIIK